MANIISNKPNLMGSKKCDRKESLRAERQKCSGSTPTKLLQMELKLRYIYDHLQPRHQLFFYTSLTSSNGERPVIALAGRLWQRRALGA
jgi:hypothetical protein